MRRAILAISVLFLAAAFGAAAQEGTEIKDYRFLTGKDPFIASSNPAMLVRMGQSHLSTVELEASKSNGGLHSLSESPDAFTAGAATESVFRITDRMAFLGKLSYEYSNGKNMGAQVLMDPYYNPINFLETDPGNVGTRTKEIYGLSGGLSYSFGPRWTAGVKIDYEAGDMEKVKDPRFRSVWMDMGLSAGVSFQASEAWTLGLSFKYRSTLEQIKGGVFGTTDKQYNVSSDKGSFLGTVEQLDGDYNYISTSNYRPMSNSFYGASIQAVHSGDVTLSNELSFAMRSGYYGLKSSSTATFFEFSGFSVSYDGLCLIPAASNLHKITLSAQWSPLSNYENTFKYVTPTGQATQVEYYGQNRILDRNDISGSLSYSFIQGAGAGHPDAEYGIDINLDSRLQTTTLYPYRRESSSTRIGADIRALRNFTSGRQLFSVGGAALFHTGFGNAAKDSSLGSAASSAVVSHDSYLLRQFEFETATRAGARLEFKYSRQMSAKLSAFISLSDSFITAFKVPDSLGGRIRNCAILTLGCTF